MMKMRKLFCLSIVIMALVVLSSSAAAQATAELHVIVKDDKGAVIKDATVTVRNAARGIERQQTQGADGDYVFNALPPAAYDLTVECKGFARFLDRNVVLTIGQVAQFPVVLKVASVTETVEVSSQAPVVETQNTSASTTIDEQRIDNLPINGRNYINFALTNSQLARDTAPSIGAAPTSGLNIGGQRARSNLVNVDGMDNVDNSVNGIRSTVSQDAVQEFQILTNGYSAEYGRSSGGVINIITKGGTNDLHGSAYGFLRNRYIQATNLFSTIEQPAYTRLQAGATLGGAIKKDKTFFFLSFEDTRRHESGYSSIGQYNWGLTNFDMSPYLAMPPNSMVLPLTTDQINLLSACPGPMCATVVNYDVLAGSSAAVAITGHNPLFMGAGFFTPLPGAALQALPASFVPLQSLVGNYPVFEGTSLYDARIDHHISPSQQLTLRVGVSPSTVTGIQVNAQGPQNFGQNAFSRTSVQSYRDVAGTAQHTWVMGNNKVNELRFEYSRRGLLYNYASQAPNGSSVAINIPGYAFFGREPFSTLRRTEQRYQVTENFSLTKGTHNFKWGVDINYLPLTADFAVNFGGLYNFGSVTLDSSLPSLSPIQAYGAGLPQYFVQGVGNPHASFSNKTFAGFVQDSWRVTPRLTFNYGVRYDVELTPQFTPATTISQQAYEELNITKGVPRDYNNFAPRVGFAWDMFGQGKDVLRGSYGIFYDHPLLGLVFLADATDATQAPQLLIIGGSTAQPCSPFTFNAAFMFQGVSGCVPGGTGPTSWTYLPNQQRFDPTPNTESVWINQNYMTGLGGNPVPLPSLPFGYPNSKNFVYAYSQQVSFGYEHEFNNGMALSLTYNFNGGHHLNRPINVNSVHIGALLQNWYNYITDNCPGCTQAQLLAFGAQVDPTSLPATAFGFNPAKPYIPSVFANFFRTSGLNPTWGPYLPPGSVPYMQSVISAYGIGLPGTNPFGDMEANTSNGNSVYHGLTVNLRKRFSRHYEMLASYTWSHAIDDSVDLQSTVAPQDNFNPNADRSNSLFDQRHRFVFSMVYRSGKVGNGFKGAMLNNWTVAPMLEFVSGHPFNIASGIDQNFDFSSETDRPMMANGIYTDLCGNTSVASKYSPPGYLIPTCYLYMLTNGGVVPQLDGNLKRNAGVKPNNFFNDLRVARTFNLSERFRLEAIMDAFNVINKFNVADVNPLWKNAGQPTAAFDPRQFQFALRLSF